MSSESLGEYINRIRKEKDITLKELSGTIGYSEAYISMVENGKKNNPSYEFLSSVAKGMAITDRDERTEIHNKLMSLAGYKDFQDELSPVQKAIHEYFEGVKKNYIDGSTMLLSFAGFDLHEIDNDTFILFRTDGTGNTIRISKEELEVLIEDLLDYIEYKTNQFHKRLDDKDHFFMSEGVLSIVEDDEEKGD